MRIKWLIWMVLMPLCAAADVRYDYWFQEATGKRLAGKIDEASVLYEHCIRLDSARPEALFEMGRLQLILRADSTGLDMMRRAADKDSMNANYQENIAAVMIQRHMDEEAVTYLERLVRLQPRRSEVQMQLVSNYRQMGEIEKALAGIDAVERREGRTTVTTNEKFEIYMELGDTVRAFHEYEMLCRDLPYDVMSRIQYGRLCQYYGDSVRAQELFDEARRVGPEETELMLLRSEAVSMLQRGVPDEEVVPVLNKILAIQPDDEMVMGYLMEYYGKQEDYERLEELCRRGMNLFPENLGYGYFLGVTLMQQKRRAEAVEVFERAIKRRGDDAKPSLLSEVWGLKGDACSELGRVEEAFAAYDSALVYNRNNIMYLNNYAYYLSLRNERMDEAERMSKRTIEAEPDNPIYLDTYAWIMFVTKQYFKAKLVMDKVVPPDSSDVVLLRERYCMSNVLEHAGDIAWMVNMKDEAMRFWRLADKRNDGTASPVLKRKIKKKRYYAK